MSAPVLISLSPNCDSDRMGPLCARRVCSSVQVRRSYTRIAPSAQPETSFVRAFLRRGSWSSAMTSGRTQVLGTLGPSSLRSTSMFCVFHTHTLPSSTADSRYGPNPCTPHTLCPYSFDGSRARAAMGASCRFLDICWPLDMARSTCVWLSSFVLSFHSARSQTTILPLHPTNIDPRCTETDSAPLVCPFSTLTHSSDPKSHPRTVPSSDAENSISRSSSTSSAFTHAVCPFISPICSHVVAFHTVMRSSDPALNTRSPYTCMSKMAMPTSISLMTAPFPRRMSCADTAGSTNPSRFRSRRDTDPARESAAAERSFALFRRSRKPGLTNSSIDSDASTPLVTIDVLRSISRICKSRCRLIAGPRPCFPSPEPSLAVVCFVSVRSRLRRRAPGGRERASSGRMLPTRPACCFHSSSSSSSTLTSESSSIRGDVSSAAASSSSVGFPIPRPRRLRGFLRETVDVPPSEGFPRKACDLLVFIPFSVCLYTGVFIRFLPIPRPRFPRVVTSTAAIADSS
mmetsp:Transcript_49046/g.98315  ORF Transcript_49046/g.98315 Transcript_49046/m.98315 type:complete len:515 (+) Transcript_49046:249-1793(+)